MCSARDSLAEKGHAVRASSASTRQQPSLVMGVIAARQGACWREWERQRTLIFESAVILEILEETRPIRCILPIR